MVQNTLQNLGFLRDILIINLFNLLVLNIASKGKNKIAAPFLFLSKKTSSNTPPQKIIDIRTQGCSKKSKIGELRKGI
jgi:hypothetical protein